MNQQNQSLPADYLAMDADWFNQVSATIDPGASVSFPATGGLHLPPVYGHGRKICVSFFQGYVSGPAHLECGIGVSNPSCEE